MVKIFHPKTKEVLEFEGYDDLFHYIRTTEREKACEEGRPELYENPWDFIIFPNRRLSTIYWRAIDALSILLTNEEQYAYEQGYDLLEIYRGDAKSKSQIVLSPNINLAQMKQNWCQDYCVNHGYEIIPNIH